MHFTLQYIQWSGWGPLWTHGSCRTRGHTTRGSPAHHLHLAHRALCQVARKQVKRQCRRGHSSQTNITITALRGCASMPLFFCCTKRTLHQSHRASLASHPVTNMSIERHEFQGHDNANACGHGAAVSPIISCPAAGRLAPPHVVAGTTAGTTAARPYAMLICHPAS